MKVERNTGEAWAPISGVSFSPLKEEDGVDVLAAIDWNQTLTFFELRGTGGKQVRLKSAARVRFLGAAARNITLHVSDRQRKAAWLRSAVATSFRQRRIHTPRWL